MSDTPTLSVVRDIDLSVRRGGSFAILGPNGVGKTTPLLALAGVYPPLKDRSVDAARLRGHRCGASEGLPSCPASARSLCGSPLRQRARTLPQRPHPKGTK